MSASPLKEAYWGEFILLLHIAPGFCTAAEQFLSRNSSFFNQIHLNCLCNGPQALVRPYCGLVIYRFCASRGRLHRSSYSDCTQSYTSLDVVLTDSSHDGRSRALARLLCLLQISMFPWNASTVRTLPQHAPKSLSARTSQFRVHLVKCDDRAPRSSTDNG